MQHVLIRGEMDRRKIAWHAPWLRSLTAALGALEAQLDPQGAGALPSGGTGGVVDGRFAGIDGCAVAGAIPVFGAAVEAVSDDTAGGGGVGGGIEELGLAFTRLKQMAMILPK